MTGSNPERPRIALYSHDTMGLGHIRRNLLLARKLSKSRLEPNVLLVSGVVDAKSFYMPQGVDCITLPSLFKDEDGRYKSRRLRMSLDEIIDIRRRMLQTSIAAFDPKLLIVDTAPRGVSNELDTTLERLTSEGRACCVLGMRDVWDEPEAISQEWATKDNWDAVRRHYDQVWVYGDPRVYDTVREYRIENDIAGRFRYTGYLGRKDDSLAPTADYAEDQPESNKTPFSLCLMGGGQDGVRLAEAFLEADLPKGRTGLLITGPFMDPGDLKRLKERAARSGRTRIIDFVPEPLSFVRKAESIVSMGGYNAVCEIISFKKRALVVPRTQPRKEQLIRAERLRSFGVLEVLHPEDLEPEAITKFLRSRPGSHRPNPPIDMSGLSKVSELAESLLAKGSNTRGAGRRIVNRKSESVTHVRASPEIAYVSTDPGVPIFGNKGASVHVQEVLSGLVRLGAKVKLFSSSAEDRRATELSGVEVHELRDWPKGSLSGVESAVEVANETLRAILADNGPYDLVYERYALWSYAAMEYARSAGTPGTLEVNAPLIEEAAKYRNLRNRAHAERVARRVFRASRQLVAVSSGVASYLAGFPEAAGKVHVVRNGVNPARFPRNAEPSRPAPPGIFTVGFVGSLKPWHGLEMLADAYAMLHEKARDTRLLIVGDGPEKERLSQQLAARDLSDSCEFTGAVRPSEVPGFVASMDVGVAPYPNLEGFYFSPLKILEYMAAGRPVVATRVGDIPELVRDGVDGFLVPPGDPAALGAALYRLMSDRKLRAAMGSAARANVLGSHTWDMVVKRILDMSGVAVAAETA